MLFDLKITDFSDVLEKKKNRSDIFLLGKYFAFYLVKIE